jgi:peptidase M28-like protein
MARDHRRRVMQGQVSHADTCKRLEASVQQLCRMRRESASEGERDSAAWIAAQLAAIGLSARIERERATGGYWWPLGLLSGLTIAAGMAALRGRRALATGIAGLAAAGIYDDLDLHRRIVRAALARRKTHNVICEIGDRSVPRTVVFTAHHDAPHSGLIFHPKPTELVIRHAPGLVSRAESDPPIWMPVIAAPVFVALGAATGRHGLVRLGTSTAAVVAATLIDIARRDPVPGAIDNATGVAALIELAGRLASHPPKDLRVMLVWTGAEEALWEGMEAFARRHFRNLPKERTFILNVDQVGDPKVSVLRGEGALRVRDYPANAVGLVEGAARELGLDAISGLRSRSGSDGQWALKAGYTAAFLGSVTEHKAQTAYHWPTDVPDVVTWPAVAGAVDICESVVRRLDDSWVTP